MTEPANLDPEELRKFNDLAGRWWDPQGEFKPLHQMNPVRLDYVDRIAPLQGRKCLDVGCGGGLFTEAMASRGAVVTGIDLADASLAVARLHLEESGFETIRYLRIPVQELAGQEPGQFDLVTCLEVLEHVPDPGRMLADCARLVRPGGDIVVSTINRNTKSFFKAIVGAEYLLGLIPRGTHDYDKLIRPSELDAWGAAAGLELAGLTGLEFNPWTGGFRLSDTVDVNYFAHFKAPRNG